MKKDKKHKNSTDDIEWDFGSGEVDMKNIKKDKANEDLI